MTDLVKKYQHYFNESVKLQETVNEQLAYIVELEEAIIALDEAQRMTPARQAVLDRERSKAEEDLAGSLGSLEDESVRPYSNHVLAGQAFDRIYRINKIRNKTVKEENLSEISNELRINYLKAVEKKVADGKNWFGGKPEGRFSAFNPTPGDAEARRRAAGVNRAKRAIAKNNEKIL